MNWHFIVSIPLGQHDLSAGYAPQKKEAVPWLAGAGLALSLGSTIFGGIQSQRAARRAQRQLDEEKAKNEAWYNRRYNEHIIDTAAGQNMMRMAKEAALENWRRAAGAAAVGGGTDAETAQAKEAGNKMVGDAIAQIEAQDVARKDNIDAAYRARSGSLTQQQMAIDRQRASNIAQVAGGVSDALMGGALMLGGTGVKGANTGNNGSPAGSGVNPATKTSMIEKMGTNANNLRILNPYIMQALQGGGTA